MRYLVTRDLIEDSPDIASIALWPVGTRVSKDVVGFWETDSGTRVIEELSVNEFTEKYKLDIAPGECKELEIIVHWIDKEE